MIEIINLKIVLKELNFCQTRKKLNSNYMGVCFQINLMTLKKQLIMLLSKTIIQSFKKVPLNTQSMHSANRSIKNLLSLSINKKAIILLNHLRKMLKEKKIRIPFKEY